MSHSLRGSVDRNTKNNVEKYRDIVTPFAGVWIEIAPELSIRNVRRSLPSRECGLKFLHLSNDFVCHFVTPFAGVWIEIQVSVYRSSDKSSHSLRGSVD